MKTSSPHFKRGFLFTAGLLFFMNLASYILLRIDIAGPRGYGNFDGAAGFPLAFNDFSVGAIIGWDLFYPINFLLNICFLLVAATAIGAFYSQERYRFEVRWVYLLALPGLGMALFSWRWFLFSVYASHNPYEVIYGRYDYSTLLFVRDWLGMIAYLLPCFVLVISGVVALIMVKRKAAIRVQHAVWNTIVGSVMALGVYWFARLFHL